MEAVEVYKKWRRSSGSSGFASFSDWTLGDRVIVDIGDTDPKAGGVLSNSVCYVPTMSMITYLHAEVHGLLPKLFPELLSSDKHGITFFGGKGVARVFKIEDWGFKDGSLAPSGNRRFKCGVFELKPGTSSSEPDFSKKISVNMIQMKPTEIAELYHNLLLMQQAFETTWMTSGMERKDFIDMKQEELRKKREAKNV